MSSAEAYIRLRERTDWIRNSNGFFSTDCDQDDKDNQKVIGLSAKSDWVLSAKSLYGAEFEPQPLTYDCRLLRHPSSAKAYYGFYESRELERKFASLVKAWEEETLIISSLEKQILNESYQRIIGLGPVAIPLILNRLKSYGGNWFWALRAISGEDPIDSDCYGNFEKMRQIWLAWGVDKELINA